MVQRIEKKSDSLHANVKLEFYLKLEKRRNHCHKASLKFSYPLLLVRENRMTINSVRSQSAGLVRGFSLTPGCQQRGSPRTPPSRGCACRSASAGSWCTAS